MSRTLSNIIYAFAGVIIGQLLGIFNSFFLAKILSPSDYGIWMTFLMIGAFSPIICLGTVETLLKEYPFYVGKKEIDKAKKLESGVIGSIVIASSFVFFLAIILPTIIPYHWAVGWVVHIRIMMASAGIALFSAFLYHRFAAHQNFKIVAFLDSFRSALIFLILVSFSWLWGVIGTVIGFFLVESIVCLVSFILSIRNCGRLKIYIDISYLWYLIKIGLPISIVWWAYIIQVSVDRGMSMYFLGKEPTGFYSLGMSITSLFILFPQVIGRVLYPKVNESVGRGAGKAEIDMVVMLPTRALSILTPVASMVLIFILPLLYKNIFNKYYPGLLSAQVLLMGVSFICIIRGGINYLVSTNRQNKLLYYMLVSISINIVLNYMLVMSGLNIFGISISTVISGVVLCTFIWVDVFTGLIYKTKKVYVEILKLYFPILFMIFIVLPVIIVNPVWILYSVPYVIMLSLLAIIVYGIGLYNISTWNLWVMEILFHLKNKVIIRKIKVSNI